MVKNSPSVAAVLVTYGTLVTVTLVMILARFYLRVKVHRNRGLLVSDLLMGAAWCAAFTTASFDIVFYKRGALDPELDYTLTNFDTPVENYEYVAKMVLASVIPFYATLYLCKLSLVAVYFQLFPIFMVKLRVALWVTLGFVISSWLVSMGLHIFLCWPVTRIWQISKPEALCDPALAQTIFHVGWALHFTGSIAIFTLPFFVIQKLKMRRAMIFAVYGTLSLGAVDIAFSLARLLIVQITNVGDFRSITTVELWSAFDIMIGLIVTCLPSLRPYLRRDFKASSASKSNGIHINPRGASQSVNANLKILSKNLSERWGERRHFEEITSNTVDLANRT